MQASARIRQDQWATVIRFPRELTRIGARIGRVLALLWSVSPPLTVLVACLRVAESLLLVGMLYAGKQLLDGVARGAVPNSDLALLLALASSAVIAAQSGEVVQTVLSELLSHDIQSRILDKATALDYARFESPDFYDSLTRAQREAGYRPVQILHSFLDSGRALVTVAGLFVLVARTSPWLGLALGVASIPFLISQTRHAYLAYRLAQWETPGVREMYHIAYILTDRQPAKEVRLFGFTPYLLSRRATIFHEQHARTRGLALGRAMWGTATGLLMVSAFVGGAAYLVSRVEADALSVSSAIVVVGALLVGQGQIRAFIAGLSSLYENNMFIDNLFAFLALRPTARTAEQHTPVAGAPAGVRFECVSFTYPGSPRPALSNIDMELRPGEIVALVGANGAGKTTLVKLLCGFYEADGGQVLLDGQDLRGLERASVWERIAVNFQDYARYGLTARENVGLGRVEEITNERRVAEAVHNAGADVIVAGLPRGLETRLGRMFDDGVDLSDGQWQRLALARAFMKDAPILVLDEPTASADAIAEYQFFERVRERVRCQPDHAVLLISHRFGNVRMADRIYVMAEGRIVEHGTHDQLVARDGIYAEMFTTQAAGYQ